MSLFSPDFYLHSVTAITPAFLRQNNIKALVLDVDNTLTTHGNPEPGEGVPEWLDMMRAEGVSMMLVSNNSRERVAPFANLLRLDFVSRAWKPFPIGLSKACKAFGLPPEQVAIVGDQLFTDILGGKWKGMRTILTEPLHLEEGPFFRFKRKLENKLMNRKQMA